MATQRLIATVLSACWIAAAAGAGTVVPTDGGRAAVRPGRRSQPAGLHPRRRGADVDGDAHGALYQIDGRNALGTSQGTAVLAPTLGDIDGDGAVTVVDLLIVLGHWG